MHQLAAAASWPMVWRHASAWQLNRQGYSASLRLLDEGHVLLVFPEGYPAIDPRPSRRSADERSCPSTLAALCLPNAQPERCRWFPSDWCTPGAMGSAGGSGSASDRRCGMLAGDGNGRPRWLGSSRACASYRRRPSECGRGPGSPFPPATRLAIASAAASALGPTYIPSTDSRSAASRLKA